MKTADLPPPRAAETHSETLTSVPVISLNPAKPARSSWWVYLILAIAVAGFGYFVYSRLAAAKASSAATSAKQRAAHDLPVVVANSRRGDLDQYLIGLGTVTPLRTATIKSRVDGAIDKINFVEGQMVHEGDPLIEIDPRPYEAALKQAQGQLAKDTAAKNSADWNVQQDELAIKDHGISQQQLHNDTATRDAAVGAIQIDQANIDTAQLNITYSHLLAPITGRIGLRLVDEGNIVHAGDTAGLAVIAQLQPITVIFTLPEDNIAQIQKRMSRGEPLEVDAYDRDLTQKLATGTLLAIDNMIDSSTGTVKIKATFDNRDNELFPSQFVNARLLVNTVRGAVLVPTAAVQHSPTSTFVYVVKPAPADAVDAPPADSAAATKPSGGGGMKGIVSVRDVTVGGSQAAVGTDGEDTTVIASGLEPGEIVVTDGVDKLQEGTKVLARPAARAGSKATTRSSTTTESATTRPGGRRGRKPD